MRLRAGREGSRARAGDHGPRHPPEAGPEAPRRLPRAPASRLSRSRVVSAVLLAAVVASAAPGAGRRAAGRQRARSRRGPDAGARASPWATGATRRWPRSSSAASCWDATTRCGRKRAAGGGVDAKRSSASRAEAPRPGVHVVALRLDYQPPAPERRRASQPAYLLLALGANPPPAVRVFVGATAIETRGRLVEAAGERRRRARTGSGCALLTPRASTRSAMRPRSPCPRRAASRPRSKCCAGAPRGTSRHGILVAAPPPTATCRRGRRGGWG